MPNFNEIEMYFSLQELELLKDAIEYSLTERSDKWFYEKDADAVLDGIKNGISEIKIKMKDQFSSPLITSGEVVGGIEN